MKPEKEKQISVPRCRMADPEIEKMFSAPPGTLRIRLEKDDDGAVRLTVFSPHTGWCDDSWILARDGESGFVVDSSTGEKRRITGIELGDGLPFGGVECDGIGNVYFLERVTEGDVWLLRP